MLWNKGKKKGKKYLPLDMGAIFLSLVGSQSLIVFATIGYPLTLIGLGFFEEVRKLTWKWKNLNIYDSACIYCGEYI